MKFNLIHEWPQEWLKWWATQSLFKKALPACIAITYVGIYHLLQAYRTDHLLIATFVALLWYAGPKLREVFNFLLPLILVAIVYDSQRFYGDLIRGTIHVEEPYNFDLKFFGMEGADGKILTPNEWWQLNTHWLLDLVTGFFYLTFISIYVLISAFFCFYLPRKGTALRSAAWIKEQQYRPMWAFFWVNVIGYSTYYWYAAAPPWYVALKGLGPADLTVQANAAGCLRFDELLGTTFFTGMYGRSADVFGAIPSLHVAYPLQSVYYAFRYGSMRAFSIFFYLIMCFSAVYLNHHYIIDLIWGSAYGILVSVFMDWLASRSDPSSKTPRLK